MNRSTPGHTFERDARVRHSVALACVAFLAAAVGPVASRLHAQSAAPGSTVTGQVYDSIARQRLPGVAVQLVNADAPTAGLPLTAVTDTAGRYAISAVPPGRYLAGFFHEGLDTLGLEPPTRLVAVGAGNVRVDLATPSPRTIMRTVCPTMNTDSTGLFMGTVRATESRRPLQGATVIVEWTEFVLEGTRIHQMPRRGTVQTTEPGWFAFCGLPFDAVLHARVAHGPDSSGRVELEVPAGGMRYQLFHVGGASQVTLAQDQSGAALGLPAMPARTALRGDARLNGTVLDPDGRPVPNAHVLVWGTTAEVTTSARGAFAIEGLPGGTHSLEVRAIGYAPLTRVVHLAASRPATIDVRLEKAAVILATETVRGTLLYSRRLEEFERRRQAGFGNFLTPEDVERRPNARLGQLLQGVLGVYVAQQGGRTTVAMRDRVGMYCGPSVYVDGQRQPGFDFDHLFGDDIAAIEIYPRDNERPPEYTDPNRCGAVLVWTRGRPAKPRK